MAATLNKIKEILKTSGLPVTYRAFPENEAPPLPYICYLIQGSDNFAADGQVYYKADRVQVELYTQHKQPEVEEKVEEVLAAYYWEKTEEYIDSEKCYQIIYELEV